MAQSSRRKSRSTSELRQRIDAITGKVKPTSAMVRGSLRPLLDKLAKQARERSAHEELATKHFLKLARFRPPLDVEVEPAEAAAARTFKDALMRRAKAMITKPPQVPAAVPQVKSGSILTLDVAPYSARWTDGSGATANHLLGNWTTGCAQDDHSFAGVCVFFRPLPGRYGVRFAPYMPHSYSYSVTTYTPWYGYTDFSRAYSAGFLGAFVSAWDGTQWVGITDVRSTLWDASVSINSDDSGSDDTAWGVPQAEFMTLGDPFTFALWAWGGVTTSHRDAPGTGFGYAQGSLSATLPWMVVEQMI